MDFKENAASLPLNDIFSNPQATVEELRAVIKALLEINRQQAAVIDSLRAEVAELKERLNKNSRNSSKPPSSDGLSKPKPSSLREKSGKKQGAQKGHTGHGFSLPAPVTNTVIHEPGQCGACPLRDRCVSCGRSPGRNVVDVEISTTVTRHYTEKYVCPLLGGKLISGRFPEGVNSSVQYGDGVRALAIALNTAGMMSVDRVRQILTGVLALPISAGTIANMVSRFGSTVSDTVEEIKKALLSTPVVNCDETGTRVNNGICWLHSACDARYTYLSLQPKRGREGMEKAGFLPFYKGTIIHDCWAPYWFFSNVRHGLCGAHLLRELQGVIDNDPKAAWARSLRKLLLEMKTSKTQAVNSGKGGVEESQVASFMRRYSIILGKARQSNPAGASSPGKRGKGKIRALIDRMRDHKDEVCLFLTNLLAPFTNNLAEQSVRMMKVKNKVSGCFRTFAGGEIFSTIMSYLQTAMKHNVGAYTAIRNALAGESHATIFA